MKFFYKSREYHSEKNGIIRCQRILGKWWVSVNGIGQTTPYVKAVWKKALRRLPKKKSVKKVLLLGLGAGGQIGLIYHRFPYCRITAVEWDPIMVKIGEELNFLKSFKRPLIIIDDALNILPRLQEKFDLILVDLFSGQEPAPILYSRPFIESVRDKLESDGYLLINAFRNPELLEIFDRILSRISSWRFSKNKLALFCHRGRGVMGDPLPSGYVPYKQSSVYLSGSHSRKTSLVGQEGCLGLRWHFGPLWFEGYESDKEPNLSLFNAFRIIIWQPLTRLDKPALWRRSWLQMNLRRTGFAEIKNPDAYWENWTSHAKRHRKKWLSEKRYIIEEGEIEEFCAAYRQTPKLPFLKRVFIKLIKQRKMINGDSVHFFLARDELNGKIIAGLAVLDLPDIAHSNHLISFIHSQAKDSSLGVGLIDYWFKYAIANSLRFLNFGVFWTPSEPKSWKGFSRFKSQFGIYLIHRPFPLIRFVGRNKRPLLSKTKRKF